MDLVSLRAFVAIAREGNLTRAAKQLGYSQPAVSLQIGRLEEELGTALFDRTGRGMRLTEAGAVYLTHVGDALRALETGRSALDELAGLERGAVRIGGGATATSYLLPAVLSRFHEVYPSIQFHVREEGSADVLEGVLGGELDLGVVTWPLPLAPGLVERLRVEVWRDDELVLIVPTGHRLEGRATFRWADLDGEPLVLFRAGTAVRSIIDRALLDAGIDVRIIMELSSIAAIRQMVQQGIGAGFVSRDALTEGSLGLSCVEGPLTRQLALVRPANQRPSRAVRALLEVLRGSPG